MKRILGFGIASLLLITSCKEQPIIIDTGGSYDNWDTTYMADVESAQAKFYLLEELTGVRCSNCPEGAEFLEELNAQNDHKFIIVGLNTGALTLPIPGRSEQDFRTEDADQIRTLVFGGEGNKPSVSFDRLKLSNGQNPYFVEAAPNWGQAIAQMKANASTTPINIALKSEMSEENYNVEVKVHFTQTVQVPLALNLFLVEDDIWDAFIEGNEPIQYNHVFRKALTPAIGKMILNDKEQKEAGLTYVYRTSFQIDSEDAKQKLWNPEKMRVVAFVGKATTEDKQVYQASSASLK